jgi:hypothetical protein
VEHDVINKESGHNGELWIWTVAARIQRSVEFINAEPGLEKTWLLSLDEALVSSGGEKRLRHALERRSRATTSYA